jgi:signal transduction histidine kinase
MFGARLLDRHRFAAYRHAAEIERANAILSHEKEFSATLVQVGRTLNATIGDPESLARQLTEHVRQVLSADWSVLFRRRRDEKIFQLAGGSGVPSEIMDELSTLGLSPRFLPFFYEALSREGTIQVVDFQRQDLVPSSLLERWGVTGFVSQGVRRDDRIIGILTSCYTKPRAPLSPREKRLLEGIANQAAVALENAGLVEAVRAADRAKSEFVATMSHELRTPLNVILGYVDLILDGTFGRPAAEEADVLNRIRHQSTELLDLIQGMLDVNRLEVRGLQLNLCEFSLGDLMEGIRGAIPRGWYKPAVRVEWEVRNERTLLRSDRTKLEMMLRNLIHNALKYTEQGTITVRAQIEPTDRFVRFEVADTGPGIAPEDLSKIFEMFGQVSARPAVGGGVGLGLYIVKRLTEALGGHVGVESLLGSGSCFTVLLPAEAPPQRAVA